MCLLLIWPAASGHSEARHHPLSVTASHRLVTLARAGVAGPQPPRPLGSAHNPAHAPSTLSLAYYDPGTAAGGTNICMHFYEPVSPWPLSPPPCETRAWWAGAEITDTGPDVTTQILSTGITVMR